MAFDLTKYANDDKFLYMLLDRLSMDCAYYLGNGKRCTFQLWADSEKEQIDTMLSIWDNFPEDKKPEWLTRERILDYKKQMCPDE